MPAGGRRAQDVLADDRFPVNDRADAFARPRSVSSRNGPAGATARRVPGCVREFHRRMYAHAIDLVNSMPSGWHRCCKVSCAKSAEAQRGNDADTRPMYRGETTMTDQDKQDDRMSGSPSDAGSSASDPSSSNIGKSSWQRSELEQHASRARAAQRLRRVGQQSVRAAAVDRAASRGHGSPEAPRSRRPE